MPKNVTAIDEKQLVVAEMFEEDSGSGFEHADKDSYAIPMLNILQKLSPQCEETDGAYIEGAAAGMVYNNVTDELYTRDSGVTVVPVAFKRSFVEWKPRETGGGFVKEHPVHEGEKLLNQCSRDEKNKDILPNGNILADTRTHYVLRVAADGTWEPAVVSMSSTQLKKSRKWMSRMSNLKLVGKSGKPFTPAMYAHTWRLATTPEQNEKGSWYGWKEELIGKVENPDLYQAAKEFKALVAQGDVDVARTEEKTLDDVDVTF